MKLTKMNARINNEDAVKLARAAANIGMTPEGAMQHIVHHGVKSFRALLKKSGAID